MISKIRNSTLASLVLAFSAGAFAAQPPIVKNEFKSCAQLFHTAAINKLNRSEECQTCGDEFEKAINSADENLNHLTLSFAIKSPIDDTTLRIMKQDAKVAGVEIREETFGPAQHPDVSTIYTMLLVGKRDSIKSFLHSDIPRNLKLIAFEFLNAQFALPLIAGETYERNFGTKFEHITSIENRNELRNFWYMMSYQSEEIPVVVDLTTRSLFAVLQEKHKNELNYLEDATDIISMTYEDLMANWDQNISQVVSGEKIIRVIQERFVNDPERHNTKINYLMSLDAQAELQAARQKIESLRKILVKERELQEDAAAAKAQADFEASLVKLEDPAEISITDFVGKHAQLMVSGGPAHLTANRPTLTLKKRGQPYFVAYNADYYAKHLESIDKRYQVNPLIENYEAFLKASKMTDEDETKELGYFQQFLQHTFSYEQHQENPTKKTGKNFVVKSLSDLDTQTGFAFLNNAYDKKKTVILTNLKSLDDDDVFVLIPVPDHD